MRVAGAAFAFSLTFVLAGCGLIDSPTTFTLATPAAIAYDGDAIIFKAPSESDTCPLWGGLITFATVSEPSAKSANVRFYLRSTSTPRDDVMALTTEVGTIAIDGRREFSLTRPGAAASWHSLLTLGTSSKRLRDRSGAVLSVTGRTPGRYFVEATGAHGRDIFTGTVMPTAGKVFVRHAVFSSLVKSYAGASQHDCGKWNTPSSAASALRRMENKIPS